MSEDHIIRGEGVPIPEAALLMGVTEHAVRKRIQRNTIQSYLQDGRRLVVVPSEEVLASALPVVREDPEEIPPYAVPLIRRIEELNREIGMLRAELAQTRRDLAAANRLLLRFAREHDT